MHEQRIQFSSGNNRYVGPRSMIDNCYYFRGQEFFNLHLHMSEFRENEITTYAY